LLLLNVPLLQLIERKNLYRKPFLSRLLAFLLLGIFFNALMIQALHHHEPNQLTQHEHALKSVHDLHQLDVSRTNCKLCEVVKNQSQFYELPETFTTLLFIYHLKEQVYTNIPQHPVRYVLVASNKGPPVI
jgi:hypothetical protein